MIYVIKKDGTREEFNSQKIVATAQANAMKLKELEELNKEQKKEPVEGSKTEE